MISSKLKRIKQNSSRQWGKGNKKPQSDEILFLESKVCCQEKVEDSLTVSLYCRKRRLYSYPPTAAQPRRLRFLCSRNDT